MRALIVLTLFACNVHAMEIGGVSFPATWRVGAAELRLNGAGVRHYSMLRIEVYVAGLYLLRPTSDATNVLDSADPKLIHVQYLRAIGRDDAARAWEYYFEQNCKPPCKPGIDAIAQFKSLLQDIRPGSTETYSFDPKGVSIAFDDVPPRTIRDPAFARLLLSTWIGAVPTSEALKRALMGSK